MAKTVAEQIAFLTKRIAEDTKKLEELNSTAAAAKALDTLKQGDIVQYAYGRGETRGTFTGEVRAIFDTDKGKGIKVIKGSGADEEIVTIRPGDIVAVGEDVNEADAPDSAAASADPLANIQ
jgi:hypothetical protein